MKKMQENMKQNEKNLQFVFSPIVLENANKDEYLELKSGSALSPLTGYISESQYNNNRIKITPLSNEDSMSGDVTFTNNMKRFQKEIDCKSVELKKIEQIRISRDR